MRCFPRTHRHMCLNGSGNLLSYEVNFKTHHKIILDPAFFFCCRDKVWRILEKRFSGSARTLAMKLNCHPFYFASTECLSALIGTVQETLQQSDPYTKCGTHDTGRFLSILLCMLFFFRGPRLHLAHRRRSEKRFSGSARTLARKLRCRPRICWH